MFCALIEFSARKFTYNSVIFSSLVGFVLGYRLIHFGYIPKQSYLLVGAIILIILIIKIFKYYIIKFNSATNYTTKINFIFFNIGLFFSIFVGY